VLGPCVYYTHTVLGEGVEVEKEEKWVNSKDKDRLSGNRACVEICVSGSGRWYWSTVR
jgi:hypothetical protein